MTKDILKLTATMLGLEDVTTALEEDSEPSTQVSRKLNDLITFLNYIVYEVTKEYYPLCHQEEVVSDERGEISIPFLSKKAVLIKDVKNQLGLSVRFRLMPDAIAHLEPNKPYLVKYNYTPSPVREITDELELPFGLSYHVISYGIASEYALSKLLYDEANMWRTKFMTALESAKSRTGERRFAARKLK